MVHQIACEVLPEREEELGSCRPGLDLSFAIGLLAHD